jgi:hypothetical protein
MADFGIPVIMHHQTALSAQICFEDPGVWC